MCRRRELRQARTSPHQSRTCPRRRPHYTCHWRTGTFRHRRTARYRKQRNTRGARAPTLASWMWCATRAARFIRAAYRGRFRRGRRAGFRRGRRRNGRAARRGNDRVVVQRHGTRYGQQTAVNGSARCRRDGSLRQNGADERRAGAQCRGGTHLPKHVAAACAIDKQHQGIASRRDERRGTLKHKHCVGIAAAIERQGACDFERCVRIHIGCQIQATKLGGAQCLGRTGILKQRVCRLQINFCIFGYRVAALIHASIHEYQRATARRRRWVRTQVTANR